MVSVRMAMRKLGNPSEPSRNRGPGETPGAGCPRTSVCTATTASGDGGKALGTAPGWSHDLARTAADVPHFPRLPQMNSIKGSRRSRAQGAGVGVIARYGSRPDSIARMARPGRGPANWRLPRSPQTAVTALMRVLRSIGSGCSASVTWSRGRSALDARGAGRLPPPPAARGCACSGNARARMVRGLESAREHFATARESFVNVAAPHFGLHPPSRRRSREAAPESSAPESSVACAGAGAVVTGSRPARSRNRDHMGSMRR